MGAEYREITIYGRDFKTAWENAQRDDERERGDDFYNGAFSQVHDVRALGADKYEEYRTGMHNLNKCEAVATCLQEPRPNKNKIKTDVKRIANKGTRKWKTVYVATPKGYGNFAPVNIMEEKLADAITKARAYVAENPDTPLRITIGKKLQSDELCAEVTYKKSTTEKNGEWQVLACVPC